jgi:hypothetical protein
MSPIYTDILTADPSADEPREAEMKTDYRDSSIYNPLGK